MSSPLSLSNELEPTAAAAAAATTTTTTLANVAQKTFLVEESVCRSNIGGYVAHASTGLVMPPRPVHCATPSSMQLWQFLLHLLTDKQHESIIGWLVDTEEEEEEEKEKEEECELIRNSSSRSKTTRKNDADGAAFQLKNAEEVSRLWGVHKGYAHMNYAKLSRALRSYYATGLISKVSSQKYVYKFMFDLRALLGYSVSELARILRGRCAPASC